MIPNAFAASFYGLAPRLTEYADSSQHQVFSLVANNGDGAVVAVKMVLDNRFNHTSWVGVVTPTDRPKSVPNRFVIEVFGGVLCCHFACWSILLM